MNWKNAISDFELFLKIERGLSKNSITNYIRDVNALHGFIIDNKIQVTPIDCDLETVQQFIYEQAKEISPHSQARRLSGLKSFFNYLIFESYRNPSAVTMFQAEHQNRYMIITQRRSEHMLLHHGTLRVSD